MIRNLITLALAMGAALLLGGLMAPSASAQTSIWFEGEAGIQTITGTNHPETEDRFIFTHGTSGEQVIGCQAVHYTNETATVDTTESEINLTPNYTECTGSFAMIVTMNGCDYRFHTPTTDNGVRTSKVEIVCPPNQQIMTHAALFGTNKCTITMEAQTPQGHAVFTNLTGNHQTTRELTVKITLSGIKYEEHAGTGFGACSNSGTRNDGTWTGGAILRGQTHAGSQRGLSIDV